MSQPTRIWILSNTASGSYSAAALEQLEHDLKGSGCDVARIICFPQDELPTIEALDSDRVDVLAIFTGDGTISSCVTRLYGWSGAVLILPGGTMNLLSHRLHGDVDAAQIIERFGSGKFERVRRTSVRSRHGEALVVFSAGPATRWYDVRETMRGSDVLEIVDEASDAFTHSLNDPMVSIVSPAMGDQDGYPLVEVTATDEGLKVVVYNPETLADYLKQGWLTLIRKFREGPHETLETVDQLALEDVAGKDINLSIDGEPCEGQAREELTVAEVEVDLIATDL